MNSIRPGLPPQVQPPATPRASDAGRAAAQRAFFELAAGKASPTAAALTVHAPLAPTTGPTAAAPAASTATSQTPTRLLRPGSLIDIKV